MSSYKRFLESGVAASSSSLREHVLRERESPNNISETAELSRMYGGSYCYYNDTLYRIHAVVRVQGYDGMTFITTKVPDPLARSGDHTEFFMKAEVTDYKLPNYGYVNIEGFSYLISLDARRRWRLGINPGNLRVDFPLSNVFNMSKIGSTLIVNAGRNLASEAGIVAVLRRVNITKLEYPSYDSAVKRVLSGQAAMCAFDRDLCVVASPFDDGAFLFYRSVNIGPINNKGVPNIVSQYLWVNELIERGK